MKNKEPQKKPNHRPLKYGEETVYWPVRVPKSKLDAIKKIVTDYLKQFEK